MKQYRVIVSTEAEADLDSLYAFIAGESGKAAAKRFIDRVYSFCARLANAPHRGMDRSDLIPGLRFLGYRRQATVGFVVTDDEVLILRIAYRGRNLDRLFGESDASE